MAEKPSLWQDLMINDSECLIFSNDDINSRGRSSIFTILESLDSCSLLVEQIRDALACCCIDDIVPMDTQRISIVDSMSEKWRDNGYKSVRSFELSDVSNITKKW